MELGRTLPSLLDVAVEKYPNESAFNQPIVGGKWESWSNTEFKKVADEIALGYSEIGLVRGERMAFYMESDMYYILMEMGCLVAGLLSVSIYLTNSDEICDYILNHSESRALLVGNLELLEKIKPVLPLAKTLRHIILVNGDLAAVERGIPDGIQLHTFDQIRSKGRELLAKKKNLPEELRNQIDPNDTATLIYTSGTTGLPKGVMLSHENISSNAMTSFDGLELISPGKNERVLSFLPMTHIFGKTMAFGAVYHGHTIYFCRPDQLSEILSDVRPTFFAAVPRLIEKVNEKILLKTRELTGVKKKLALWATDIALQYDITKEPSGWYKKQLAIAKKLVLSKWTAALGGEVKGISVGGAALDRDLVTKFGAAGVQLWQGYGLTETSPVITFNRPRANRVGTVGTPMSGVEVKIAEDGEILTRGPHVMKGYYRNPEETKKAINSKGWFHTGDIGEFTEEGFLKITDRKKSLFKLSTGKYVIPQPVENKLVNSALIEQAMLVGSGHKYCTALIFPNHQILKLKAEDLGVEISDVDQLCQNDKVRALVQDLIDGANEGMAHWETVKDFILVSEPMSIENGLLTPKMSVRRNIVRERYADLIEQIYERTPSEGGSHI